MIEAKPAAPEIVAFSDHEVITPDTGKLRNMVHSAQPGDADPVARAELALAGIAGDFSQWMIEECERLDAARRDARNHGLATGARQALFLAAHDVKGYSKTLGYPEVARTADSLCRLIDLAPDAARIPMALVDQHVDALRAIVREHERDDIGAAAESLADRLRTVTDDFLVNENQGRPDVLKALQAPPQAGWEPF